MHLSNGRLVLLHFDPITSLFALTAQFPGGHIAFGVPGQMFSLR